MYVSLFCCLRGDAIWVSFVKIGAKYVVRGKLKYESKNADENPECMNAIIIKNRYGDRGACDLKWN